MYILTLIPICSRILDHKHWYESDQGWIEGAHSIDRKDKIIHSRGLIYCFHGIPTKSKVLKLHFNEIIKKGWFRTTTVSYFSSFFTSTIPSPGLITFSTIDTSPSPPYYHPLLTRL